MSIVIKNKDLEATFLPEKGMNMISFKKEEVEIIDQSTKNLFEERFAGLGAIIGPHFHRRNPATLPQIKDEQLFPHIARVKAKGVQDPFSHGIGRYAPWQAKVENQKIEAILTGKDLWEGVALSALEGQNFKMQYAIEMTPTGLELNLSVVSDRDSLVGIHFYLCLPSGQGKVVSQVQNKYIASGKIAPIPQDWNFDSQQRLVFDLKEEADYTFYPFPNSLEGTIVLETDEYHLKTSYSCASQENCWQLYHPKDSSFVCIEPISAQDPRHPNLTVSALKIRLEILDLI